MNSVQELLDETLEEIRKAGKRFQPVLSAREVGCITSISSGIAKAVGLPQVGFSELIRLPQGLYGLAFNVDKDDLGIVLVGEYSHLKVGDEIERTGRVMDVPVGPDLIGRVINPLGQPLDGKGPVRFTTRLPIERQAPSIMDREPVEVPLQTGIKAIDALIPIGRGQRELILGDRKTGKTALALDMIVNQRDQNVVCIYCAICQRASAVAKSIRLLQEKGAMDYSIVMVTEGNDTAGMNFIAPYAATSIGEYFMEQGRDVLVVYDDLTQHAREYRELSLLLKRPPGRAAFPGDIFYIHSRLLERATRLRQGLKGGSLTALPIIETQAQNISAYIATNLISITDGQISLSPTLFELGILPAVDVNKSVSRVGGKAQLPAYREIVSSLKLSYAQFEELEEFVRFGARLDEHSRYIIEHGRRIRECLKQEELHTVPVFEQLMLLLALSKGFMDEIPLDSMRAAEEAIYGAREKVPLEIRESFQKMGRVSTEAKEIIVEVVKKALAAL